MRNHIRSLLVCLLIVAMLLPCLPILASAAYDADAALMEDVLNLLGKDSYRNTYNLLLANYEIKKGSEGTVVKGLQSMLKAFGEDISVDSYADSTTIDCMRHVQSVLGLETTQTLDLASFKKLLIRLAVFKKNDDAYAMLVKDHYYFTSSEFEYVRGCCMMLKENYYSAKLSFEKSMWGDYRSRAASCARSWPEDGLIWQKDSSRGSHKLVIKASGQRYNSASVYKIYKKSNNKLVATLFIGAEGKASVKLAGGEYYMRLGTGSTWYGDNELFGDEVVFDRFEFYNGDTTFNMSKYSTYTITIDYT